MLNFNDREFSDYSDIDEFIKKEVKREKLNQKKYRINKKSNKGKYVQIGKYKVNYENILKLRKVLISLGIAVTIVGTGLTISYVLNKDEEVALDNTNNPYDEYELIEYKVKYGDNLWNLAKNSIMPGSSTALISEKVATIKNQNKSLWNRDYLHEGEIIYINVSIPCLSNFGYKYDPTYNTLPVSDQINDKIEYLTYMFQDYHKIIDTFQEKKVYSQDFELYQEIKRKNEILNNEEYLNEERRIEIENEILDDFEMIYTDMKLVYNDNHEYMSEFAPRAHKPTSEDILDPFFIDKTGLGL